MKTLITLPRRQVGTQKDFAFSPDIIPSSKACIACLVTFLENVTKQALTQGF